MRMHHGLANVRTNDAGGQNTEDDDVGAQTKLLSSLASGRDQSRSSVCFLRLLFPKTCVAVVPSRYFLLQLSLKHVSHQMHRGIALNRGSHAPFGEEDKGCN